MTRARVRMACWLLAQGCQALGVGAFFLYLTLEPGPTNPLRTLPALRWELLAWIAAFLACSLPAPVLAHFVAPTPLLRISSSAAVLVLAICCWQPDAWRSGWIALAGVAAFIQAAGDRLAPAAAKAVGWPLGSVHGWRLAFQLGGLAAGIYLAHDVLGGFDLPGVPPPLWAALLGLGAGAILNLAVRFPIPAANPFEPDPLPAPLVRRCRREHFHALACLAVIAWIAGVYAANLFSDPPLGVGPGGLLPVWFWMLLAGTIGAILAAIQEHPRRRLGYAPWCLSWAVLVLLWGAFSGGPGFVSGVWLALLLTMPAAALAGHLLDEVPRPTRPLRLAAALIIPGGSFLMGVWIVADHAPGNWLWILCLATLILALLAWRWFLREAAECVLEYGMFPMYRIRGHGPGLPAVPLRGPLLVIANHSSWLDPVWLGKVLPRRLIPMMTSVFYDLPVMRWMMMNMAEAIRVEASTFRRDVPELAKGIDTLDNGECLVLFPEGFLRRKEHQHLRNFGQGVWHILKERPHTPVVVCWIEGGWGSYFSFFNGPPTKNKKLDRRRPIDIAVTAPERLPADILADRGKTRAYLMEKCLQARGLLGLEPPKPAPPEQEKEVEKEPEEKEPT